MQDCVIKLGKWYRTAVAEARGRFFARFFSRKLAEADAKQSFSHQPFSGYLISSMAFRKYKNCMLEGFIAMHTFVLFVPYI